MASDSPSFDRRVVVHLRATSDAPILKQAKFKIAGTDKFSKLIEFLRRQLHRDSLFVYLNSAFSPNPDELVIDLYNIESTWDMARKCANVLKSIANKACKDLARDLLCNCRTSLEEVGDGPRFNELVRSTEGQRQQERPTASQATPPPQQALELGNPSRHRRSKTVRDPPPQSGLANPEIEEGGGDEEEGIGPSGPPTQEQQERRRKVPVRRRRAPQHFTPS